MQWNKKGEGLGIYIIKQHEYQFIIKTTNHHLQILSVKLLREGEKMFLTVLYKSPIVGRDETLDILQDECTKIKLIENTYFATL